MQSGGRSGADTRVTSRNIRWAAAAMAAMLLISGASSGPLLYILYTTLQACTSQNPVQAQLLSCTHYCAKSDDLQRRQFQWRAHAGVTAAMNLREAWAAAMAFSDSYEYAIVKVRARAFDSTCQ